MEKIMFEKLNPLTDGKIQGEMWKIDDEQKFIETQEKQGLKLIYKGDKSKFPSEKKSYNNITFLNHKTSFCYVFVKED